MSSSSGKKQSTETPTKRLFSKFLSRKKKSENGKKQSTEGINNNKKGDDDDAAAGMRTCEEVGESGGSAVSGSPIPIKQKRKKKKKDGKEATVEEDETKKEKDKKSKDKEKDDLKTAKRKKGSKSGKKERTQEDAGPQPSGMATVFEAVKAPSRPAVAHGKDLNDHIKEDMERIEKEEKEKEKQQQPKIIDEFAPTVFEPVQAQCQPAIASSKVKKPPPRQVISPDPDGTTREKPMYGIIPKENAVTARERKDSKKVSAESTTTGKERSKKAEKHSDSQDDGADCKTAMIPASAIKIGPYQMVMYKGVPRYEPINNTARPYVKSEKEVAAKIQILPQPSVPTSPTFPAENNYNQIVKTPAGKNCGAGGGVAIGNLPKDPPDDPKKDGPSPVSQYVAPLDR